MERHKTGKTFLIWRKPYLNKMWKYPIVEGGQIRIPIAALVDAMVLHSMEEDWVVKDSMVPRLGSMELDSMVVEIYAPDSMVVHLLVLDLFLLRLLLQELRLLELILLEMWTEVLIPSSEGCCLHDSQRVFCRLKTGFDSIEMQLSIHHLMNPRFHLEFSKGDGDHIWLDVSQC